MATTTLTGASSAVLPRLAHTGINVVQQVYTGAGATLSASDILLSVKIPNRATVVDAYIRGHGGATTTILKLGDSGSDGRFGLFTLIATDTLVRPTGATSFPYTYALSDDAVNQFATLQITVSSAPSPTATSSFVLVVFYTAPGNI